MDMTPSVTALRNHILEEQPRLFFMHFWGVGARQAVADGIKAALTKIKTKLPVSRVGTALRSRGGGRALSHAL